jgi:hypothetical protein
VQGDEHPKRVLVRERRQQVLEQLSSAFAADQLGLEEYEERVTRAYQTENADGLERLLDDLKPTQLATVAVQPVATNTALLVQRDEAQASRAVAILGNLERAGRWTPRSGTRVLAVLGNIELDFREALLPPGVTEIHVRAVLGNIELIVPPNLVVECDGASIAGSFATLHRVPPEGSDDAPRLRIVGTAVLGNVEIHTRPTGMRLLAKPVRT